MDKYRYSRATFVIGMVLAIMIERNLHLSVSLYGEWFVFTRPIALIMFVLIIVTTAWPFFRKWQRDKQMRRAPLAEKGGVS
jgi:TctA family transporter